jgi:hypothetical protein
MTVTINGSGSITEEITIDGVKVGQGGGNVTTNTAVGVSALAANEAGGTDNTAIGYQALDANTTGDNNVAVGNNALGANTTAANNTAIGVGALASNTTAFNNTAVGRSALTANTTGSGNTALGRSAGVAITTGDDNTVIGREAGESLTTGANCVFVGSFSGEQTTGADNTFVGKDSGYLVTTGAKNTILGRYNGNLGGLDIRTSSNHIVLSDGDGNPRLISDGSGKWIAGATTVTDGARLTVNSSIAITNGTYYRLAYQSSDQNFYFSNGTNQAYLSSAGSWTNASDARLKTNIRDIEHGLNTVLATQPRHYERIDVNGTYIGFVAQELQTVIPEVVSGDPDTQLGVDYGALVAVAFKAIQELSAQVTALQAEVNALKGQ